MLSVLIVNWNTRDLLLACLNSLTLHPPEEPMEIIVVDNASADGSSEAVRNWIQSRQVSSVALIASEINHGYAKGNNIAFEQAKGDWLLTLNPDTEVFEDTLQRAIDTLRRRQQDGALGARQVSLDGSTQRSVRGFPTLIGILKALLKLPNDYEKTDFDYDREQPADQPMGTFLLFRRRALEDLGDPRKPFDESFPIFFNEVDLLYRLRQKGWGCVYDPQVRVLHHGGESTKQVRPKMIWESHRSLIRYLKKHTLRWWNAPLLWLVFGAVWLGALARTRIIDVGFRP